MPVFTVEYTSNLKDTWSPQDFLAEAHTVVVDMTGAKLEFCKSKVLCYDDYRIAEGAEERSYVLLTLELLAGPGREDPVKEALGKRLADMLRDHLKSAKDFGQLQVRCHIKDLGKHYYF